MKTQLTRLCSESEEVEDSDNCPNLIKHDTIVNEREASMKNKEGFSTPAIDAFLATKELTKELDKKHFTPKMFVELVKEILAHYEETLRGGK